MSPADAHRNDDITTDAGCALHMRGNAEARRLDGETASATGLVVEQTGFEPVSGSSRILEGLRPVPRRIFRILQTVTAIRRSARDTTPMRSRPGRGSMVHPVATGMGLQDALWSYPRITQRVRSR